MFDFKLCYFDSKFHKTGEKPFMFPPEGFATNINANVVEVEGDNGTGKTTFLNCLALALGYLDERSELKQKKRLLKKLQLLDENKTLSYFFNITGPPLSELKSITASRIAGQETKYSINSVNCDLFDIKKAAEVIFLTDDDPRKDVKNSLRMISNNFREYDEILESLTEAIGLNLQGIRVYNDFKAKEKKYLDEIAERETKILNCKNENSRLTQLLVDIKNRDDTRKKIELLRDRKNIETNFEALNQKYNQLEATEEPSLVHKIGTYKVKLHTLHNESNTVEAQINTTIKSLALNGVKLDGIKLINGDWKQYNELRKEYPEIRDSENQQHLLEDMLSFFNGYSGNEVVPYFEKSIEEIVEGLTREKAKRAKSVGQNRIYGLMTALEKALHRLTAIQDNIGKIEDKITDLSRKLKNLAEFEKVQKQYNEAKYRMLELKTIEDEDIAELLKAWTPLSLIKGDIETVNATLSELEVTKRTEEQLKSHAEQNLCLLRESASKIPKNVDKEAKLHDVSEEILALRGKLGRWISILEKDYSEIEVPRGKLKNAINLAEDEKFFDAIGEFIGLSFEPVDYNYQKWKLKSYNLRNQTFVTQDNREIDLEELSRGQTRQVTLVKILNEMKPEGKKKILLVDEIADLDASRLNWVRETLKKKLAEGSLMLAVMVRPRNDETGDVIKIRGIA